MRKKMAAIKASLSVGISASMFKGFTASVPRVNDIITPPKFLLFPITIFNKNRIFLDGENTGSRTWKSVQ
jgi:hypothetical protein